MNWFSHWDEDLEAIVWKSENNSAPVNYDDPTKEEINELFETNDEKVYEQKSHQSISTNEYKATECILDLKTILKANEPIYIRQFPYVGDDGIYIPCEEYVPKGTASAYKCILTKEMFVEAYNKWVKDN